MTNLDHFKFIGFLLLVSGTCALRAYAGDKASFHGLGDLQGGQSFSSPNAISGNGLVVVGVSVSGNGGEATLWQLNSDGSVVSIQGLGDLPGGSFSSTAGATSIDGSVVVGNSNSLNGMEAFRWSAATGMVGLGDISGGPFLSFAVGVSADGSVVAGSGQSNNGPVGTCDPKQPHFGYEAFRWTADGGIEPLGFLPGLNRPQSGASCVSHDGSLIGGYVVSDPSCSGSLQGPPVSWFNGNIATLGIADGRINDCSPDGTVLVGVNPSTPFNGFVWTKSGGMVVIDPNAQPMGVSSEGHMVVGAVLQGTLKAFIWDSINGMRVLKDVLVNDFQLDEVKGWNLQLARGVSDNGLTIVGQGINPQGVVEGWVVKLPCQALLTDGSCEDVDTDGDGLSDDWEKNGIPYTDSFGAEQRYILSFDGDATPDCDPNRKDIFVEVDAMTGLAPNPSAFISVKAAFNAAPVSNPNGAAPGIKLHVIEDELNIPVGDWTQDDTNGNGIADWPTEFDALKLSASSGTTLTGYFGTALERNDPDGAGMREARAKAFRYCIFGRSMDAASGTTGPSGIAEIGGNDFAVTMALWSSVSPAEHAGTFMHELGHTLGLRHGGADNILYKPNYYSVMNYAYQTPKAWMPPNTWPLEPGRSGFSAFALPTLNENALNECAAQVVPGSSLAGAIFVSSYVDDENVVNEWFGRYDLAIDWNNSGDECKDPIINDINRLPIVPGQAAPDPSPGQTLLGHDDWASLDFNFRDSPAFAPGVHNSELGESAVIEITFEENQAIANMLPPFCAGEIVPDRQVNVADLLAVINQWGTCVTGCEADIAPIGAPNGDVDVGDLLAVINHWGPCR